MKSFCVCCFNLLSGKLSDQEMVKIIYLNPFREGQYWVQFVSVTLHEDPEAKQILTSLGENASDL